VAALVAAVRERLRGQSIPAALRGHILHTPLEPATSDPRFTQFVDLVESTPAWSLPRGRDDPQAAITRAFDLLEQGWKSSTATPDPV
jgi:hypothetical protein